MPTISKRQRPQKNRRELVTLEYKVTLKKDWTFEDVLPLPKKPQNLPVVLSPEEVVHFLGCVAAGKHRVILTTCYAAGLRVSEAVRLKAAAIDNRRMVIRVELSNRIQPRPPFRVQSRPPLSWAGMGLST